MSGIINKVKDAVAHHGDKSNATEHHQTGTSHNSNAYDSNTSSNHGPHSSNVANAADPRVDSDRSAYNTSSTGHSTVQPHSGAGMTGVGHSTAQPHSGAGMTGVGHSTAQPHSGAGMTGAGMTGAGMTGAGMTGASHNAYDSSRSSNYGPHSTNMANTADPRVDSDRSAHHTSTHHSGAPLATGAGAGMAGAGMTGAGMTGAHHNINDSSRSSNYGPHGSNMVNAADPRIDSDRSAHHTSTSHHHSGAPVAAGAGMAGAGAAAAHHNSHRSSNYGPHDSNVANTADPRIDSHHASTGGVSNPSTHSYATGPASSTAGPHKSNLANKADPRVDSDLSKQNTHSSVGNAGVMPISGGSENTTTRTFEHAQETSGAAGSSYNHHGSAHPKGTAGLHNSSVANKVDPRVDSDLDHSATLGSQRI